MVTSPCLKKYNRAFCQFKIADKLYSDERTKDLRNEAKNLLDAERERKWEEEYGEEYAKSISENGQYWDKWVNEQGKLRDWFLSILRRGVSRFQEYSTKFF